MKYKLQFDCRRLTDEQLSSKYSCYRNESAMFASYAAQVSKEIRRRKKINSRNFTSTNSDSDTSNNMGAIES